MISINEAALLARIATLETQLAEAAARAEKAESELERWMINHDGDGLTWLFYNDRRKAKTENARLRKQLTDELDPEGDSEYQRGKRADHERDMNTRAEAIAECHRLRDENARLREGADNELGELLELERALMECLSGVDCPHCDNSGGWPVQRPYGYIEQQQCEWCYTFPYSKFNVKRSNAEPQ